MNKQQTAQLQHALEERKGQLLAEIREVSAHAEAHDSSELAGGVADPGDDAVADLLITVDHAMVDRDAHELNEIELALKRIADGEYGQCIDCAQDISFERLAAFRTALRCIRCQAVREKTYAHPPMPPIQAGRP